MSPRKQSAVQKVAKVLTKVPVRLNVNGSEYALEIEPRRTLLEVLRLDLNLTGTKMVCNMGECGACTVLIDGKAAYSCLTLAVDCANRKILTIEGLSHGEVLDPIQQAFIEQDAFQCGYCTPGQIMAVKALLEHNENPDKEEIRTALSGNICRCGAYPAIIRAAESAVNTYRSRKTAVKVKNNG